MTNRNVVLVTWDAVRADHCGYTGYKRDTTPTLDSLAEEGIAFENCIASSIPSGPSMYSVFTGRIPLMDGHSVEDQAGWNNEIQRYQTLAEVYKRNGYATAAFHPNTWLSSKYGFDKGFDDFHDNFGNRIPSSVPQPVSVGIKAIRRSAEFTTAQSILQDIIQWRKQIDPPYFCWVHLMDTHAPWIPTRRAKNWSKSQIYTAYLNYKQADVDNERAGLTENETEELIKAYDDQILYADKFLSDLTCALSDDDPIYAIHSDHGDQLGEEGVFGHWPLNTNEELLHVPLVISGIEQSKLIKKPVGLRNLAKTITSVSGIESSLPGRNIIRQKQDYDVSVVLKGGEEHIIIRLENKKYVINSENTRSLQTLNDEIIELDDDQLVESVDYIAQKVKTHMRERNSIRGFAESSTI